MAKRIVFTFDERAYEDLVRVQVQGKFASLALAVKEALSLYRTLQEQAAEGYDQICVENRKTKNQKSILMHRLLRTGGKNA
jgi:hypothetical protein